MGTTILRRLSRISAKLRLERDWYLMLMAALIGVLMGAVATLFIWPLRFLEQTAEHIGEDHPRTGLMLVGLIPIAGALLAGVVMRVLATSAAHAPGITGVMYAIHREKSRLPFRVALNKWIASTLTIGSGGSAGPEGPIVTIGGVIGSCLGRLLKTTPQNTATLLGCGAAAGLASVFNAPIAGIFFVLEVLLRDFSLRTFTPIVIASVISATSTQSILGTDDPLFGLRDFPMREGVSFTFHEVPNFLLLGLVCGVVAPLFIRMMTRTESFFEARRWPSIAKPAVGAGLLGLMGVTYLTLAPSEVFTITTLPPFYSGGYTIISEDLLSNHFYFTDASMTQLAPFTPLFTMLVAVSVLKAIATCLTIGSGGSGGLFAPSLFLGAGIGGAFGALANWLHWFPAASPAHYALVGMAAMVASLTHAPLTGIMLAYELTRQYDIVLPLMLVAVISTIVARLIQSDSIYTWKLTRMGVQVGGMSDLTILRRLSVHDVPLSPAIQVHREETAQRLLELSETHGVSDFVVVDDHQHYVGLVTGADLQAALVYREAIPLLQVSELQRADVPTVGPDESLDLVLGKFSLHDVQSLAVINQDGLSSGAIMGLVTRSRLMQRYQNALSED
jgi:chloride channel protein, CIC family